MVSLKENWRKVFHVCLSAVLLFLIFYVNKNFGLETVKKLGYLLLLILLVIDIMRIEFGLRIPLFFVVRKKEENRLNALVLGVIAGLFALEFYDYSIALAVIAMTMFSDPAAAVVGMKFGTIKIYKKKSLQGSLAAFATNLIIASMILKGIILIIITSLAAAVVELFSDKIDDNLTIPIFAGLIGQIVLWLL